MVSGPLQRMHLKHKCSAMTHCNPNEHYINDALSLTHLITPSWYPKGAPHRLRTSAILSFSLCFVAVLAVCFLLPRFTLFLPPTHPIVRIFMNIFTDTPTHIPDRVSRTIYGNSPSGPETRPIILPGISPSIGIFKNLDIRLVITSYSFEGSRYFPRGIFSISNF